MFDHDTQILEVTTYRLPNPHGDGYLFSIQAASFAQAIEIAKARGVDFSGARFRSDDDRPLRLSGVNLAGAKLRGAAFHAALDGANLSGADMRKAGISGRATGADFSNADLREANLSGSNFMGANFTNAKLAGADFSDSEIAGAIFVGADFAGVDISRAKLSTIEADVAAVLRGATQAEVAAILEAIKAGKFDGSANGGAPIVGFIAAGRGSNHGLVSNLNRYAERFAAAIKKGDKPAANPVAKILADWLTARLPEALTELPRAACCPTCGQPLPQKKAA